MLVGLVEEQRPRLVLRQALELERQWLAIQQVRSALRLQQRRQLPAPVQIQAVQLQQALLLVVRAPPLVQLLLLLLGRLALRQRQALPLLPAPQLMALALLPLVLPKPGLALPLLARRPPVPQLALLLLQPVLLAVAQQLLQPLVPLLRRELPVPH